MRKIAGTTVQNYSRTEFWGEAKSQARSLVLVKPGWVTGYTCVWSAGVRGLSIFHHTLAPTCKIGTWLDEMSWLKSVTNTISLDVMWQLTIKTQKWDTDFFFFLISFLKYKAGISFLLLLKLGKPKLFQFIYKLRCFKHVFLPANGVKEDNWQRSI